MVVPQAYGGVYLVTHVTHSIEETNPLTRVILNAVKNLSVYPYVGERFVPKHPRL